MKKVLIVEDDPVWAKLIRRYVSEAGADSQIVIAPGQALEMIDDWYPDALVLDMLLASETGMALLNELKSHEDLADLPIIVCSNVGITHDDMEPFGVRAVLDKSTMTPAHVRQALTEVLL